MKPSIRRRRERCAEILFRGCRMLCASEEAAMNVREGGIFFSIFLSGTLFMYRYIGAAHLCAWLHVELWRRTASPRENLSMFSLLPLETTGRPRRSLYLTFNCRRSLLFSTRAVISPDFPPEFPPICFFLLWQQRFTSRRQPNEISFELHGWFWNWPEL